MKIHQHIFLAASSLLIFAGSANALTHNDDVEIIGSLCVGFDCPPNTSFGFDTIRLQENNLRIKFQDTSNSASFPTNDWQLTANDSTNGGAEKFSIEDISGGRVPFTIEANAPSHSLYVDDGGRLGLGTNIPSVELHLVDGDSPTVRLAQDGSSGFAPQTWDMAGNETNFFIRDVTNGSKLPFRIRPDAPTSSIFIDTDGDVGMGTSSPSQSLDIESNGPVGLDLNNSSIPEVWRFRAGNGGNFVIADAGVAGSDEFVFSPTGDLTILGGLVTGTPAGTCNPGPCDATFQPDKFTVPSIEEHAAYMWENSHLWAVGPTSEGKPMNLTKKTGGILHELEVAHIYIEQLSKRINDLEHRIAAMADD